MLSAPTSGNSSTTDGFLGKKKKSKKSKRADKLGRKKKKKREIQGKVILQGISPIFKLLGIPLLFFFCLCIWGIVYVPDTSKRDFLMLRGHTGSGPDRAKEKFKAGLQVLKEAVAPLTKQKDAVAVQIPHQKSDDGNNLIDMRELAATLPFDNPDGGAWKQGWNVEPVKPSKEKPVKIFVVPHSHCDPGWIKTFDDYFQSQTKQILSTVVASLAKDPKRKFIWAEISYFEWWWREQPANIQELTKKLLANRQFEFVTGGWVQPDEANTQLYAMEIQLQEGHDFIRQNFGEEYIPKYGWSIDPFGYSPTMAYLLKKYDFKAMLIQRVHYAVKKELAKRQHLEFNWRQIWDETGEHDIYCHVMPFFSYDVPHTCGPDPSVCCQFDFARLGNRFGGCPWRKPPQSISPFNLKERSLLLLDQYLKKASLYRSGVVIAPLGDDFRYQSVDEAEKQFTNYQKMFDYINSNVDGVHIQFGTLREYFEASMGTFEAPLLKGSFFTYADVNEDYWSGYFTSRIFDKSLDRQLERVLYAATSLGATTVEMQGPRRALSLFQHHDGITGTAKNHVVEDYAKRIHDAIGTTQDWIASKLQDNAGTQQQLKPCWRSNSPRGLSENLCQNSNSIKTIKAYNPLNTSQVCGSIEVPGQQTKEVPASVPCDVPGLLVDSKAGIQFDPQTGLMTTPIREDWMVWKVSKGGAYLFFPGELHNFNERLKPQIIKGGLVATTDHWKRGVVEKKVVVDGQTATVIDFVYETNLQDWNQEWFVRFSAKSIQNQGIFHTDLNGFDFDTHMFRKDLPLQSQVFPMPTLASIEDDKLRMTILSEHAQGTASTEEGTIDIWLDRRLRQDDARGLGQGVLDNVPTRTRLRIILEEKSGDDKSTFSVTDNYKISPLVRRMWDELNHPLELFGVDEGAAANA